MRESPMGMSQLGLYQQCQRRWFFKYLLGWIEREELLPVHLIYGQAIHGGKETFYKSGSDEQGRKSSIDYIQSIDLDEKTRKFLTTKAHDLWDLWPREFGFNDLKIFNIIGVEREGWLELLNGINLSVRLDLLVNKKDTKYVNIIDTKTTKRTPGSMLKDYFYKAQPKIYTAWLLNEEPTLRKYYRGWITDVASQRDLKNGLVTELERSEPKQFTDEEIKDAIISLSLQTDEMRIKIDKVVNNEEAGNFHFQCNYNNCLSYGTLCPYHTQCASTHYFGDSPPSKFTLDPWVEERKIIKEFV